MKRIIYSLVAMLFMGGIITSCIENPEPEGVKEMRLAHARYLDALSGLRAADAKVQEAEANLRNALAAVQQGIAAQEQAKADNLELLNQLLAANNEADIADLKAEMEENAMQHKIKMAGLQAALAQAQKDLADALAAIEIEGLALSQEELDAIGAIKDNYDYYAGQLEKYYADMAGALEDEWYDAYDAIYDAALDGAAVEYIKDYIEEAIALDELYLGYAEQEAEYWKGLLNEMETDFLAEAKEYKDAVDAMATEFAELLRDSVAYANVNGPIRDKAIEDAQKAYEEAVKQPKKDFDEAVKDIKKNVDASAVSEDLMKGEAKAKTFKYGLKKSFVLPEHVTGDLIDVYEAYLNSTWYNYAQQVEFVKGDRDTLKITIKDQDTKKAYDAIADSVWAGVQSKDSELKMSTGLWSAYNDFSREYLYDLGLKGLEEDAEVLKAAKDSIQDVYDSILNILKNGGANKADILLKAWYDKVVANGEDIETLAQIVVGDAVPAALPSDFKPAPTKYNYNDVPTSTKFEGGIVLLNQFGPRAAYQGSSEIKLEDAHEDFFDGTIITGADDVKVSQSPTAADSLKVFNDVVNFFKAVASINEDAVPYLKFITSTDGVTFKVDKVRADKMEFAGVKAVKTNGHLLTNGLLKAARYDSKALDQADLNTVTLTGYIDAFSNIASLFAHYIAGVSLPTELYDAEDDQYTISNSGIGDYISYVENYYNNNYGVKSDSAYPSSSDPDFAKYAALSAEGQALADWLDASEKYFGVDELGSIAEKVFFTRNTFAEPTNIVIWTSIPTYTKDAAGNVDSVVPGTVQDSPYTSQYGFTAETIVNNMAAAGAIFSGMYVGLVMVPESLPFQLLAAEYLVYLSENSTSFSETWKKLGEVLENEVKPALDKAAADADAKNAKSKEDAKAYNDALKDYRAAVGTAADDLKKAVEAANKAYDDGMDEACGDRFRELIAEKEFNEKMYNGLMGAYAMWADGKSPVTGELQNYLIDMYEAAIDECADYAEEIAALEIELNKLDGIGTSMDGFVGGIDNEYLNALVEVWNEVQVILADFQQDKYEDLVFWYEYWKAAYEEAIAYVEAREIPAE